MEGKINLGVKITDLFGKPIPKTNPSKEEIKALEKYPKLKNRLGEEMLDFSNLPNETLGNFLISCLSIYQPKERKENFYVQILAAEILGSEKLELKEPYRKFILGVMDQACQRIEKVKVKEKGEDGKEKEVEKDVKKGVYISWAVTKAKMLMGEKE